MTKTTLETMEATSEHQAYRTAEKAYGALERARISAEKAYDFALEARESARDADFAGQNTRELIERSEVAKAAFVIADEKYGMAAEAHEEISKELSNTEKAFFETPEYKAWERAQYD